MVSKFFSQTFPTAVNITTAYNHNHKHRYSRSVLFQVDAQYRQDNTPPTTERYSGLRGTYWLSAINARLSSASSVQELGYHFQCLRFSRFQIIVYNDRIEFRCKAKTRIRPLPHGSR